MYGCGDVPIKQGDVFLVNNYTLPHWVYNGSNDNSERNFYNKRKYF